MNMQQMPVQKDSDSWVWFTKVSFAVSVSAMVFGIIMLPVEIWIRAFLGMGLWFSISSTITLSKTMRDQHEARQYYHQQMHRHQQAEPLEKAS